MLPSTHIVVPFDQMPDEKTIPAAFSVLKSFDGSRDLSLILKADNVPPLVDIHIVIPSDHMSERPETTPASVSKSFEVSCVFLSLIL